MPGAAIRMANPASAPASPVSIQAGTFCFCHSKNATQSTRQTSSPALVFSLSQPAKRPATAMPAAMPRPEANGFCR